MWSVVILPQCVNCNTADSNEQIKDSEDFEQILQVYIVNTYPKPTTHSNG